MDQKRREHFESADHALAAGVLLGHLHRAIARDQEAEDIGIGISSVRPFMDDEGNYTNQMLVRIGSHDYTITIDEAVAEAMHA